MRGLLKGVQSVLIAMIILAILGTGIILFFNNKTTPDETQPAETASDETLGEQPETEFPDGITNSPSVSDNSSVSSNTIKEHTHSYKPSVRKQATCTQVGEMKYTCDCGDFYIDSINALEHKEGEWKVVRKATRTATGLKQIRCTRCNVVLKEEVIPKTTVSGNGLSGNDPDHRHSYKSEITKEKSCTENGETTYKCECGSSYKLSIPATNHPSRETIVTDSTCDKPGTVITSCSICKAVISQDTLSTSGHNYSDWKVVKEATTSADGSRERTCDKCGNKETETIPKITEGDINSGAHSHAYAQTITTAADCLKDGVMTHTCTCSDTYTEPIPALGHNPGNWTTVSSPTAETPGLREKYCRRCGEIVETEDIPFVPEHKHKYNWRITKEPTCTMSGTKTYTCTECGDYYTTSLDMLPHQYDAGGKCLKCGKIK